MANPHLETPEGARIPDGALEALDAEKRALCADFRRALSDLLNREAGLLGLKPSYHEIEIYY